MQRSKIRQQHKALADGTEKPKIKKLTKEKVAEEHSSAMDHLDLAHRGIESIETTAFEAATALKRLDLSANKLTRLAFSQNMALTQLKASSNLLVDGGIVDLSYCKLLVTLDLSDNKLARLPGASLRHCTGLKALVLTKNALTSLEWVPSLPGLTSLIVSHNRITDISAKSMGKLKGLTKLQISHNKLTELPDLTALEYLTELRASHNQLTALPATIHRNENLKIVDVCHNNIDTFDGLDQWSSLQQLKQLNLRGNPLCGRDANASHQGADSDPLPAVSLDERKALDKKNKLYNFKMKRLFPALIVRDGHRVQEKRTHGYVAPPPVPKAPKPVRKSAITGARTTEQPDKIASKKRRKEARREASSDAEAAVDDHPTTLKGAHNDGDDKTNPSSAGKQSKKADKRRAAAPDQDIVVAPEAKRSKKNKEPASNASVQKCTGEEEQPKTLKPSKVSKALDAVAADDTAAKKEKGRKKKEKYAKDSGVLGVVHVKKPSKSAVVATLGTLVDFSQLDSTGGIGLGGESSWD
ncbi:hypothetical protein H310_09460 [Aphanomyces invadans]|uniref:U2A'/phosphoprotein 32 family A C-terminal domain-containing protein n=1 Tax=Aphanomyces invadans TaxID=157072 RepID=A0A024TV93_9STRA|nr:hypothetical protein H310_09460 [Aphanomyces invadans]ETV97546.1 hypothetical protein H310_09460 [Aphanomyces invadans]|eukprot:XP_008873755.1 hypothetical protein H310_09460 [Aphanomyces invadans]